MDNIKPVICCIAKLEHNYIREFVKYHLSIGFDMIYIYDNEDTPTYENILKDINNVYVIPYPGKGLQYTTMDCFRKNLMPKDSITHVINLDCDEFIVLKKHNNIKEFINEYIKDDCVGIGINWRFFGDSGKQTYTDEPLMKRFTLCQQYGDQHVKTLFNKNYFKSYNTMHHVFVTYGHIKSTNGTIINSPWNPNIDLSVIQINHYKTKTLEEFIHIRSRGYADFVNKEENILQSFHSHNCNEVQDLTAYNYYTKYLQN
jgi:hypothetical protein